MMLYPENTSTRTKVALDGVWSFALIGLHETYDPQRPLENGRPMPVPCAYNDIYEGREIRDHVGTVVYERTFDLPQALCTGRLFLRFGSVTHAAQVWLNGNFLGSHKGGFLPFAFDVTDEVRPCGNRLTVLADNIVDHSTLPCGTVQNVSYPGMGTQTLDFPNFDYFNYSGIMRPVVLYAVPASHITEISVQGSSDGAFRYAVKASGAGRVTVQLLDGEAVLWQGDAFSAAGRAEDIIPWSPCTPHLYRLRVLFDGEDGSRDQYDEFFGFRDVCVRGGALFLNGQPLYLKGFGKHEDVPVLGRGFSQAYNVKDLGLLKWLGANSFRTSHYPYSEEMMRLCDRMGILVIDETPAVGMHTTFTATGMKIDVHSPTWETLRTQEHHREVLRDMIQRDQNHPCVIMWSIANEPASEEAGAYAYFKPLFDLAKELDPQKRPLTFATHGEATVETCEVAQLCDVIMLNRYYGWYSQEGDLAAAAAILDDELERYHARYPDKPIMLGEFGADAIAGFHDGTPQMFSEEYQRDMIRAYCRVLDGKTYICGEHVWNFADFATAESVKRVQGNKKGVFTRERKPKLAAWYLQKRWREGPDAERGEASAGQ